MPILDCITQNLASNDVLELYVIGPEDLEDVRQLHNHPLVIAQLTNTNIVSRKQQENWYQKICLDLTMTRIVVREIQSKCLVGVFRVDRIDDINRSVSIGLDVHPNFQGKGLGRKIYFIILDLLFFQCGVYRVYLETLESNYVARRLYESLGMMLEGEGRQALVRKSGRQNLLYYGLLKAEWYQKRNGRSVDTNQE